MRVTPSTGTLPGTAFPLGATVTDAGTNFAVASTVADGMKLCLFDETGGETPVPMRNYDADIWHVFVPGAGAGQAYGYRATGPWDPPRGVYCNPAKLLLDPYGRAVHGTVTFGPEVYGYSGRDPDSPGAGDSAASMPRSLVVAGESSPRQERGPGGTATRTRSSTRCTSRASPCVTPRSRPSCGGRTPA